MRAVVEKYAPEVEGMEDAPPDPMRDLDFQAMVGRPANSIPWEWCPYCPANPALAERSIVGAVRRLKMGRMAAPLPQTPQQAARCEGLRGGARNVSDATDAGQGSASEDCGMLSLRPS
jgi:hypothetical protein